MKIIVKNISKNFGNKKVLKDISITFGDNNFTGILGPNGAGKSTLMKIITGQIKAKSGNVNWINDQGKAINNKQRARLLGFVHQNSVLDDYLTVKENLISRGSIKGLSTKETFNRINELNSRLDVKSIFKVPYGRLSGGQKRRVDIVSALLHKPKILILDEPTTGIDPEIRNDLWKAINEIKNSDNVSIILITHYLEEMNDVSQLVVLLNGNINFNGSPNDFISKFSDNTIQLTLKDTSKHKMKYSSLSEKVSIINDAYNKGILIDFKDEPQSLEGAYLTLLNNKEID